MAIQSEKKIILSEWRDEKAKLGQGISRVAEAEVAAANDHSVSSGADKGSAASAKFDEAALAAKREKVEHWRKIKMEEREAERVSFNKFFYLIF